MSARSVGQRLALVVFGVLLAHLLLEGGLRLAGGLYLARQERGNRASLAREGAVRILCLGESTTQLGGAESFPRQLETILNQRRPARAFTVVNAGLSATTTDDIVARLERQLERYRPDLVVTMMGINDMPATSEAEEVRSRGVVRWIERSRTYKLYRLLGQRVVATLRGPAGRPAAPPAAPAPTVRPWHRPEEPVVGEAVAKLREGRAAEARALLEGVAAREPEVASAHLLLDGLDRVEGRRDGAALARAESTLRLILERDPARIRARAALARIYLATRRPEEARQLLARGGPATLADRAAVLVLLDAHEALAAADRASRRWDAALEHLEAALRVCPPGARYDRARVLGEMATLEQERGDLAAYGRRLGEARRAQEEVVNVRTQWNYLAVKRALDARGIRLVAVQYPVRELAPLRAMLGDPSEVVFVDNERAFREALRCGRTRRSSRTFRRRLRPPDRGGQPTAGLQRGAGDPRRAAVRRSGRRAREPGGARPGRLQSARGRNLGSVTSGVTSSKTTSTGIPTRISGTGQSTRLETTRAPSSSAITTTAYGTSLAKPGW
jgi:lysophospholipase L1-like esterase